MEIGDRVDVTVFLGSGDKGNGRIRRGVVVEIYVHHAVVACFAGYRVCMNTPCAGDARRLADKPDKEAYKRQRSGTRHT